MEGFKGWLFLD